jgi:hypothetical protein
MLVGALNRELAADQSAAGAAGRTQQQTACSCQQHQACWPMATDWQQFGPHASACCEELWQSVQSAAAEFKSAATICKLFRSQAAPHSLYGFDHVVGPKFDLVNRLCCPQLRCAAASQLY